MDTPPTEVLLDDIKAVLEAARCERPILFATGDCGWMALLYAASYPDRVGGLIVYGAAATWRLTDETPWGSSDEEALAEAEWVRDHYGTGQWSIKTNPSIESNEREVAWAGRYERLSLTPGAVYTESLRFSTTDVTGVLPFIQVPALVLHRLDDPEVPVEASRNLASENPDR